MRDGKGKMRSGVSEKRGKGPGPGLRMVPNMGAGGSHPQTMQRVPEETGNETEREERKEEKKEEGDQEWKKEVTSMAGRILEAEEERQEMEKAEAAKEAAVTEQKLVVERMETAKEAETEFEAEVLEHSLKEKRDEQWESVRRHELLSEGRREAEKLGEKMAEELKTAARKGETGQEVDEKGDEMRQRIGVVDYLRQMDQKLREISKNMEKCENVDGIGRKGERNA